MAVSTLRVIHNGQIQDFPIRINQTLRIPAKAGAKYQLFNEHGALMIEPHTQVAGQDLLVFAEQKATQPFLVIENYRDFAEIVDKYELMNMQATLALGDGSVLMPIAPQTATVTAASAEVATQVGMTTGAKVALGAVGVLGVGLLAAAGGGGSGEESTNNQNPAPSTPPTPSNPTPSTPPTPSNPAPSTPPTPSNPTPPSKPQPTVRIVTTKITDDNIINIAEQTAQYTISGKTTNATNGTVNLLIDGKSIAQTQVQADGSFTATVKGQDLVAGSLKQIVAKVTANGETATSAPLVYQVDTVAPTASVEIKQIAENNILNLNEVAKTDLPITGNIGNLESGATAKVTINVNGKDVNATVSGNTFTAMVNGADLAADSDKQISAKIIVTDKAGNSSVAQNVATYTVEPQPKPMPTVNISTDKITADNIINATEAAGQYTISGKTTNATNGTVNLLIDGKSVAQTTVSANGDFTATVKGQDLVSGSLKQIVAQVTANGETATSAPLAYQVDTVAPTASVEIKQIAENNILNLNEVSKTDLQITGNIGNLESGATAKVTVNVNGKDIAATVSGNTFTAIVNGADLAADSDKQISAKIIVTDKAGNSSVAQNVATYTVEPQPKPMPTVNISTDKITADNIINATEAAGQYTISGKTTNATNGTVNLLIDGKSIAQAQVQTDGTFTATVKGQDLVSGSLKQIVAQVTANGETATSAPLAYQVDTVAPTASVEIKQIAENNILNLNEIAKTDLQVMGNIGNLESGATAKVTVNVNGKDVNATVSGNTFTAMVNGADLAADSDKQISAKIVVTDKAGNSSVAQNVATYTVEPQPKPMPTVQISTNKITDDNIINIAEQTAQYTISGKTTNATNGTVNLLIDGKSVAQTTVSANGSFTATVKGQDLVAGSLKQIVAKVTANGETATSAPLVYQVDTVAPTASVEIKQIAENNILNLNEVSKTDLQITGTIGALESGATAKVTVNVNGKDVNATVSGNTFTAIVNGADLAADSDKQISAKIVVTDKAGNSSVAQNVATYTVEPSEPVSLTLEHVSDDNVVALNETPALTRISGSLDVSGQAPIFRAKGILQNIALTIGSKTFERVGLVYDKASKGYTFTLDVPTEELTALQGQPISYDVGHQREYHIFYPDSIGFEASIPQTINSQLNNIAAAITLNSPVVSGNQGSYTIANMKTAADTETLSGSLKGSFVAGEVVNILLNNQTYTASVDGNGKFTTQVSTQDLVQDSDKKVEAVLARQPDKTDVLAYTVVQPVTKAEEFVAGNQHAQPTTAGNPVGADINAPYFIKNLTYDYEHTNGSDANQHLGYLEGHIYGNKRVITYHIPTQAELDEMKNSPSNKATWTKFGFDTNYENHAGAQPTYDFLAKYNFDRLLQMNPVAFNNENTQAIHTTIEMIEKYANVDFVEVNSVKESNLDFYLVDFTRVNGAGAFNDDYGKPVGKAGQSSMGGDVYLSSGFFHIKGRTLNTDEGIQTAVHETLHSLGFKHPHLDPGEPNSIPHFSAEQDSGSFTTMSYLRDVVNNPREPHLYDIATLHYFYGVNTAHRAGNDTYTFKDYNPQSADGDIYIWDGAGVDTFDASKEAQGVNVNLSPGSLIYADKNDTGTSFGLLKGVSVLRSDYENGNLTPYTGNDDRAEVVRVHEIAEGVSFIGYGTQLENLIGSAHDDLLTGNAAHNLIQGGAGNDKIAGKDGNDTLMGGNGNDQVQGDAGDDILYGGLGVDTLTGGAGKDQFVFNTWAANEVDTITDFNVNDDKIALSSVFHENTLTQFSDYVQYNKATGELRYDQDGKGTQAEFVTFAKVTAGLDIEQNHFVML